MSDASIDLGMSGAFLGAFVVTCVAASVSGAALTSHYYTTAVVAEADISCDRKTYHKKSQIECASECSRVGCYKFVFKNGICEVTETKSSVGPAVESAGNFYKKVIYLQQVLMIHAFVCDDFRRNL